MRHGIEAEQVEPAFAIVELGNAAIGHTPIDVEQLLWLQLQALLEDPCAQGCKARAASLVASRFEYVVACQMYGEQRRLGDPTADDVDLLLSLHPRLRVAYVDRTPAPTADSEQGAASSGRQQQRHLLASRLLMLSDALIQLPASEHDQA